MSFLDDGVCRDIVVFIKFLYRKCELEVCSLRTYSVANLAKSVTLGFQSITIWQKASLWILIVSLFGEKRHFGFSKYRFLAESVTLSFQSITIGRKATLWIFKVSLFGEKRHFEFSKCRFLVKCVAFRHFSITKK